MPTISIQVKPSPGDVVHGRATIESSKKGAKKPETTEREIVVYEGVNDTFEVELADEERIVLEFSLKEKLVLDHAQGTSTRVPIEAAPQEPETPAMTPAVEKPKSGARSHG